MPVQIDSRLHCKMCQCTDDFVKSGTQSNNSFDTQFGVTLGPLYRFGPLGPPALPGLPMASYATGLVTVLVGRHGIAIGRVRLSACFHSSF